jgi:hypothetical protein
MGIHGLSSLAARAGLPDLGKHPACLQISAARIRLMKLKMLILCSSNLSVAFARKQRSGIGASLGSTPTNRRTTKTAQTLASELNKKLHLAKPKCLYS